MDGERFGHLRYALYGKSRLDGIVPATTILAATAKSVYVRSTIVNNRQAWVHLAVGLRPGFQKLAPHDVSQNAHPFLDLILGGKGERESDGVVPGIVREAG